MTSKQDNEAEWETIINRVPGGWLYFLEYDLGGRSTTHVVFVPKPMESTR